MSFLPEGESEPDNPILNFPDFITHSNYLQCLEKFSKKITLECKYSCDKIMQARALPNKIKLIHLTHDNLAEEFRIIHSFHEYSVICSSWIPVKSYYLIFNCLLVFGYLMYGDESYFTKGHKEVLNDFKKSLTQKKVSFSNPIFNVCINGNQIERWHIPKSENLRGLGANQTTRLRQIIKKLYLYSREDYKKIRGIKKLSGKRLTDFKNGQSVCLFDFFYWYRIKANYRDMEFINEGVPVADFFFFYRNYFEVTMNFYSAFSQKINQIATDKLGRQIL